MSIHYDRIKVSAEPESLRIDNSRLGGLEGLYERRMLQSRMVHLKVSLKIPHIVTERFCYEQNVCSE